MYRVVIIDDDEWILRGIECTFPWAEYGFCVEASFTEPKELFDYLKKNRADVIFTDIKMPGITGLELIEGIREDLGLRHILFIIISAYDDYDFMRKAINLGVVDYCRKPIRREAADSILRELSQRLARGRKEEKPANIAHDGFQKIIDYINENLNSRLTLKELSRYSSYNANYICSLFRDYTNMSFSKYLLTLRMQKAKELFDSHRYSVKEVQSMVGYTEYSYFHSAFTKYFGITPAKYLKGETAKERED